MLLAIEDVLKDNRRVSRSTQSLLHTWKLVCLCYHTWESCSSQREQGSPKALQSPRVPPTVVAAGYIWSSAAGVFIREERKEKENRNISQKSVSIYFFTGTGKHSDGKGV